MKKELVIVIGCVFFGFLVLTGYADCKSMNKCKETCASTKLQHCDEGGKFVVCGEDEDMKIILLNK